MQGLHCAKNNGFSRSRSHSLPLGSLSFGASFGLSGHAAISPLFLLENT
jgi:hypothetical protein